MVGQGEVGGRTRRVQTAWPCLGSSVEQPWLAPEGHFCRLCLDPEELMGIVC